MCICSMFDRVDGSRRKLLATEKSVTMFDRADGSKPARGSLLKIEGILPTAANQSKIGFVGILSYGFSRS